GTGVAGAGSGVAGAGVAGAGVAGSGVAGAGTVEPTYAAYTTLPSAIAVTSTSPSNIAASVASSIVVVRPLETSTSPRRTNTVVGIAPPGMVHASPSVSTSRSRSASYISVATSNDALVMIRS